MTTGTRTVCPLRPLRGLGRLSMRLVGSAGGMGLFLLQTFVCMVSSPLKVGRLLQRIQFIGFHSMLVVCLAGAFTGMVLGLQGYYTLNRFGAVAFLGPLVGLSLVKELGPVLTGLIVTGRAGSALASEMGIMRIDEEIDALTLMGLNPFRYLVVPTLLAGILCLPLLTAMFNLSGIAGGYLVGVKVLGVSAGTYVSEMVSYVRTADILEGTCKAMFFGGFISWIACHQGYHARFGAEGVSRATTRAVVLSSVTILMWDYLMSSIFF